MKLTAPEAAFLHLCSLIARHPSLLTSNPDLRREIFAIFQAGCPCADSTMSRVKWAYLDMCKAGGFTGGDNPVAAAARDGGVAFWNAWQDFGREVDAANRARARAIMGLHFERAAS